jgi:hypothetical protein
MAVNENGAQPLEWDQVRSLFGGQLAARVIWRGAGRNAEVRRQMLSKLAERIDSPRIPRPRPFALRYYSQYYQDEKQITRLRDAVYVPPPELLERLDEEQRSKAAPLPPEKVSHRDFVVELGESHCVEGCTVVEDGLASAGSALRLTPSRGAASAAFAMPKGSWFVFVRMRTKAAHPHDVVYLQLESRQKKPKNNEIGNYKRVLPPEGWVWSSSRPGWPALELSLSKDRRVAIMTRHESVDIDQIWLSEKQSELPISNAPVVARRKKRAR